jgi:hypothetical protein
MNLSAYFHDLQNNSDEMAALVRAIPADQIHIHENDKWSILQILEHVWIVEKACMMMLARPSATHADKAELHGNDKIKAAMLNSPNRRVEAPASVQPKGKFTDIETLMKSFFEQRSQFQQDLEAGKLVVDNRTQKHASLGEMTMADWMYFMLSHTQRHMVQIRERLGKAVSQK